MSAPAKPQEMSLASIAAVELNAAVDSLGPAIAKRPKARARQRGLGGELNLAFDAIEQDDIEKLLSAHAQGARWSDPAFGHGGVLGKALSSAPRCAAWLLRNGREAVEAFGPQERRLNPASSAAVEDVAAGLGLAWERSDMDSAQAILDFLRPWAGAREGIARRPNALSEKILGQAFERDDAKLLAWIVSSCPDLTAAALRGVRGALVGLPKRLGGNSLAPWAEKIGKEGAELTAAVRGLCFGGEGSTLAMWALAENAQHCAAALLKSPAFAQGMRDLADNPGGHAGLAAMLAKSPQALESLGQAGVDLRRGAFGLAWAQLAMLDNSSPAKLLAWAAKHDSSLLGGDPCPFEAMAAIRARQGMGPSAEKILAWRAQAEKAALWGESRSRPRKSSARRI